MTRPRRYSAGVRSDAALLLEVIDKIVVVTIPSAVERQADVSLLMQDLALPFEFHLGRDCRTASVEELVDGGDYDPVARARLGRPPLTPSEIGCALSHRDVATRVAHGTAERVLVLEDDVRLIEANTGYLGAAIASIPRHWSLAYFAYAAMNLSIPPLVRVKLATYYPLRHMLGSERHDPVTIRRIYRRPLNAHWMLAGWFNDATAYAIDREAARYISESQRPVAFEADLILNHLVRFSGLAAICLKYPLFDQRRDIPSLIGERPSWKSAGQR